jgi:uncharacterized protein YndB with AHSA1/START domain
MNARSTHHATFVIDRAYDAPPARVFQAWADIKAKAKWFAGPDEWKLLERKFDFRIGGSEKLSGRWPSGLVSTFDSHYHDIVPDQRLVYAYDMHLDERHISVSLATVEFRADGAGSRLIFTEQLVNLDDFEDSMGRGREQGTRAQFDKLEAVLRQAS